MWDEVTYPFLNFNGNALLGMWLPIRVRPTMLVKDTLDTIPVPYKCSPLKTMMAFLNITATSPNFISLQQPMSLGIIPIICQLRHNHSERKKHAR